MADLVRITDVSARDGLQNEPGVIATTDKARLVELVCATGVDEVEATSFVSPAWVPQLGDAEPLLALLASKPGVPAETQVLSALVPNTKGLERLMACNRRAGRVLVSKVSVFAAASESFSKRNTNGTIDEVLGRLEPVLADAERSGLATRAYVSCAVACPFEGPVDPARVADVAERLARAGAREIDLGDTIGAGTPDSIRRMLSTVAASLGTSWFAEGRVTLHLHDTFGRAVDCVRAALDAGVRSFDGAVGGLGGCPYASTPTQRAPGNIDAGALVSAIHEAGFATRVNEDRLDAAAAWARSIVAAVRSAESTR